MVISLEGDAIRHAVGHAQYGVGVKGALEKLHMPTREAVASVPDATVLLLDAQGAFSATNRTAALEEAARVSPRLARAAAVWLRRQSAGVLHLANGDARFLRSTRGLEQGCAGSPALFALAVTRVTNALQGFFRSRTPAGAPPCGHVLARLDDLTIVTSRVHVNEAMACACTALLDIGLVVNAAKSRCWTVYGGAPPVGVTHDVWMREPDARGVVVCEVSLGELAADVDTDAITAPMGEAVFVGQFLENT